MFEPTIRDSRGRGIVWEFEGKFIDSLKQPIAQFQLRTFIFSNVLEPLEKELGVYPYVLSKETSRELQ